MMKSQNPTTPYEVVLGYLDGKMHEGLLTSMDKAGIDFASTHSLSLLFTELPRRQTPYLSKKRVQGTNITYPVEFIPAIQKTFTAQSRLKPVQLKHITYLKDFEHITRDTFEANSPSHDFTRDFCELMRIYAIQFKHQS